MQMANVKCSSAFEHENFRTWPGAAYREDNYDLQNRFLTRLRSFRIREVVYFL